MAQLSCALGVRQPKLDEKTRAFFRAARPWAFILFREACVEPAQVRALCAALREAVGHEALIWIDQEGGRVARLKPPHWPIWPAAALYGETYARDADAGLSAARLGHRLIAHELKAIGVNADFAPVLDLAIAGADKIVGDRAFSRDGKAVPLLARAALDGLHEGGVAGCIKHMPGHGRALADSHFKLPRVSAGDSELAADIAPFAALADAEAAMTAHIIYEAWDKARPATCSPVVIESIIRTRIGFDGLLMSDDIDMKALAMIGGVRARAEAALKAGCDVVLQCSGDLREMEEAAQGSRLLAGRSLARARAVEAHAARAVGEFDAAAAWGRFNALLGAGA